MRPEIFLGGGAPGWTRLRRLPNSPLRLVLPCSPDNSYSAYSLQHLALAQNYRLICKCFRCSPNSGLSSTGSVASLAVVLLMIAGLLLGGNNPNNQGQCL